MDDITKADVLDIDAALVASDDAWVWILAYVNRFDLTQVEEDEDTAQLARIYLAAHMVKASKAGAGSAAGPVTSESVGGVRRSYALVAMSSASSLRTTRYGQLFLDIVSASLANGPFLV